MSVLRSEHVGNVCWRRLSGKIVGNGVGKVVVMLFEGKLELLNVETEVNKMFSEDWEQP